MKRHQITLEGLTPDEILSLPDDHLETLVLCGEPLVFSAGSAEILGRFWIEGTSLILELGHIEGGGEGVLPTIAVLAERYAHRRGLSLVDWRVHALNCVRPNPKLRPILERRGFAVVDVPGTRPCYQLLQKLK